MGFHGKTLMRTDSRELHDWCYPKIPSLKYTRYTETEVLGKWLKVSMCHTYILQIIFKATSYYRAAVKASFTYLPYSESWKWSWWVKSRVLICWQYRFWVCQAGKIIDCNQQGSLLQQIVYLYRQDSCPVERAIITDLRKCTLNMYCYPSLSFILQKQVIRRCLGYVLF